VIAQSCVGMAAYFMESELESFRDRGLTTMNEYNNDTYPDIKELRRSWDLVQSEVSSSEDLYTTCVLMQGCKLCQFDLNFFYRKI
jgi:hypothetical protein